MNNLIISSSGKIGSYYSQRSKLSNNIFTSRKKINVKGFLKINFNKKTFLNTLEKNNISKAVIFTAISDPFACVTNKKISHKINIVLIKKIIDLLIKKNIYFIFFSSEYIFLGNKKNLYRETSKANTKMLYGKQKIIIEKYLKKKNYNNYSILRLSKTYGDQIDDNTLFCKVLKDYLNGKTKFEIAHDQYFRPLYINDLIRVIDHFLKKKIRGDFNVCGDQYLSRYNLIKKMFETLNITNVTINKCSLEKFNKKVIFPKKLNLSNKKIKNKIGIKFTNFEKILKNIDV